MPLTFPCFYPRSERGSCVPDITPQSPYAPTTPVTRLEPWEKDLMAFFGECKPGVEDSPERERALMDCFPLCNSGVKDSPERKKARRFTDRLNWVRCSVEWPSLSVLMKHLDSGQQTPSPAKANPTSEVPTKAVWYLRYSPVLVRACTKRR